MEFVRACARDGGPVFQLTQNTIRTVYPDYYLPEIVDFFAALHSREAIARDIAGGCVYLLRDGPRLIGTGTVREDHIARVFVGPEVQGRGCGGRLMDQLERIIFAKYDAAYLDASLPASRFYEGRGYQTLRHERCPVENGRVLVYEIMKKTKIT